ncbi:MAG TPA: cyclase family protein [Actinomycetota bacterium]|nr:cyclase family protein [Actinomycetota bacterium]
MIVDLSVTVDATTLGPPAAGSPPVVLETVTRGPGHWQSSRLAALLHTGSHVDTPLHVVESGRAIEALRLDEVCGPAVVIDVHDAGEREAIGADRLRAAGNPPAEGDIVVVRTGWTDRWWGRFPGYYTRSPFLTEEAARWLASIRPKAVVVDFFEEECAVTPDFTSEDFVVHRALLGNDIPIVEQATNLGAVGDRFELRAPFVRLAGVEAAPCRIYAEMPDARGPR